jgi:hypothetical protein
MDENRKRRTKSFIIPESGRKAITIDKKQIKEFKKMAIDFEVSEDDILKLAVDLLINRYHLLTGEIINEKGVKALFE